MPQIAKVVVEAATYAIDRPYDYLASEELHLQVGSRVLVPFGRGNRTSEAMVLSLYSAVPKRPLKAVRLCLDPEPLVTDKEIRLALWMVKRYFCTFYDAIHTILPAAVWYHYAERWEKSSAADSTQLTDRQSSVWDALPGTPEELKAQFGESVLTVLHQLQKLGAAQQSTDYKRRVGDKTVEYASLAIEPEIALERVAARKEAAPRQYDTVKYLADNGETPLHELFYFTGAVRQTVTALKKRGIVALRGQEEYRITEKTDAVKAVPITLNDEQQAVLEQVLSQAGTPGVTLLHGVTGSGKTLVYIRLAQELLAQKKSVMILVPEIALTPQMMARFTAYFGDEVALLHSGLRPTERYDQWKRIRRGEAHIVLGTRSAVFAPLQNLGWIVMDEEQEPSYESESAPCYHARDIAKFRCAQEGARLLLGSATPTVETAWNAYHGNYQLSLLRRRYNEMQLPRVIVADMRSELRRGNTSSISNELRQELMANLQAGEQSILFLNRRGASRQLLCPNCGYVPQCPRCSVYMTYHSANDRMMCHYCGHSEKAPQMCPECGGSLKHIGIGTQKVAEELEELFPGTPILRMDADTVGGDHETLLRRFSREKIPILLGTQMVAKGLDFADVTLVGVLAADMGLYVEHYRAAERTFSLLTQVVGRAGRGERPGRAVLQTYTPENEVILAAARQDYPGFYDGEIRLRKLRRDPPFADQLVVTVTGTEEIEVRRAAAGVADSLRREAEKRPYDALELEILGPAPAPIVKVNNRYRYRIMVVGRNDKLLRELLASYMREFAVRKEHKGMNIYTDCNLMD